MVIGAAALIQAGLDNIGRHVEVLGFHHTGWLGLLELGFGAILMGTAFTWRGGMSLGVLGILAAAFGLVILLTDRAMHSGLGVHPENATLFIVLGAAVSAAGFFSAGATYVDHRHTAEHSAEPDETRRAA